MRTSRRRVTPADGRQEQSVNGSGEAPAVPARHVTDAERLFSRHLPLIQQIVASLIRRHQVSHADADEFRSTVYLRLIEHDYRILREFKHRSSMSTFLGVVIARVYLDFRNHQWGKWRPSAAARRDGLAGLLLERLIARDGFTLAEAVDIAQTRRDMTLSGQALAVLAAGVRVRPPRRTLDESAAAEVPDPAPLPDEIAGVAEWAGRAGIARRALEAALGALDPQDREIIDLRFGAGFSIADISRVLQLDQRPLYRRFERVLDDLRRTLEADAPVAALAKELMRERWSDFEQSASRGMASKVA